MPALAASLELLESSSYSLHVKAPGQVIPAQVGASHPYPAAQQDVEVSPLGCHPWKCLSLVAPEGEVAHSPSQSTFDRLDQLLVKPLRDI